MTRKGWFIDPPIGYHGFMIRSSFLIVALALGTWKPTHGGLKLKLCLP